MNQHQAEFDELMSKKIIQEKWYQSGVAIIVIGALAFGMGVVTEKALSR